jgi:alkaline phosphatase D
VVASAAAPLSCSTPDAGVPEPSDTADEDRVFPQGVASGDPRPDGVLLWTRATPEGDDFEAAVPVRWFVATDEDMTELVAEGELEVGPDTDHCLRLRMTDLEPGTTYYYRFSAGGVTTRSGRTRTAPADEDEHEFSFAITSCQEYVGRWYHAWRELVERDGDIDFVLFLGDYIYESIADPRFQPVDSPRSLSLPDGMSLDGTDTNLSALTLADYRALYRQYRTDPDLKEAHRRFPWVIMWDDHEFVNDCWQDVANEFDGARGEERDTTRREAATQAWFEYLPIDVPYQPEAGFPADIQTYRTMRWGRHAELFLTDSRYYRDDHLIPETEREPLVGKFTENSPLGSRIFALKEGFDQLEAESPPSMLGAVQKPWLTDSIGASTATWKLFASALMMAQLNLDMREEPDIPALLQNNFYFKVDQWDGFRTERRMLLETLASVDNLVVLSGDLHGNYAAELRADFDDPSTPATAVEFTVTGISSISLQEQLDLFTVNDPRLEPLGLEAVTPRFDEVVQSSGPHFAYANSSAYGYAVVRVATGQLRVQFVEVPSVDTPTPGGPPAVVDFFVDAGTPALRRG